MTETRQKLVTRLADYIVYITHARGQCVDADLYAAGFSDRHLKDCLPAAQELAEAELKNRYLKEDGQYA